MKIFLSWSGEASRRVADLLRQTLPCMIQQLEPFMSKHDLSSGGRWAEQLSAELDQCNFGIICLTPENLQKPWILFEAGALTKHVEGRACCLLFQDLGLADVSGPLSQFQNRLFSRNEFQQLLFDLNELVENSLDEANLQRVFEKWWPDLDEQVKTALDDPDLAKPVSPKRGEPDMLEEILLRLRSLQSESRSERGSERYQRGAPSVRIELGNLTIDMITAINSEIEQANLFYGLDPRDLQLEVNPDRGAATITLNSEGYNKIGDKGMRAFVRRVEALA